MSFILAGVVALGTLALCALMAFAAGMSSNPSASAQVRVWPTFVTGMAIAALLAASHWLPHISW